MAKPCSGKFVIKILCKYFDFSVVSQKGSHVKLERIVGAHTIITIVPLHRELMRGTFKGILDLAEINEDEFWKQVR